MKVFNSFVIVRAKIVIFFCCLLWCFWKSESTVQYNSSINLLENKVVVYYNTLYSEINSCVKVYQLCDQYFVKKSEKLPKNSFTCCAPHRLSGIDLTSCDERTMRRAAWLDRFGLTSSKLVTGTW